MDKTGLEKPGLEKPPKEKRRNVLLPVTVILLLLIVGTVLYYIFLAPKRHYTGYGIKTKIERKNDSGSRYLETGGKMISYNKEGVLAYGREGEILWNAGVSFKNPKLSVSGNYVAVADIGGREVCLIDQKKSPVTPKMIQLGGNVFELSVSERGQVAVLMEEGDGYLIQIIEPDNKQAAIRAEIKTLIKEDGYALTLALSKDGSKLVTSFLQNEENEIRTNLTFYNFASVGEEANADRIVGIFPYKDTVFGKLSFLGNDMVCAFGDNKIVGYSMKREPNPIWEKKIQGKIAKVSEDRGGIALLITERGNKTLKMQAEEGKEKEDILDEESVTRNGEMLYVLSPDGSVRMEKELEFQAHGISHREGETVIFSDETVVILKEGGSEKFRGKFNETILSVFQTDKGDRYFLVTTDHIEVIKLNE